MGITETVRSGVKKNRKLNLSPNFSPASSLYFSSLLSLSRKTSPKWPASSDDGVVAITFKRPHGARACFRVVCRKNKLASHENVALYFSSGFLLCAKNLSMLVEVAILRIRRVFVVCAIKAPQARLTN